MSAEVLEQKRQEFLQYKTDLGPNERTTRGENAETRRGSPKFLKDVADNVCLLLEETGRNRKRADEATATLMEYTATLTKHAAALSQIQAQQQEATPAALSSKFEAWKAQVHVWVHEQRNERAQLHNAIVRLQTRTDVPAEGQVEPIRVQPQWERQLLWMGVGLSCALSCGTFALGLFWVLRGVL